MRTGFLGVVLICACGGQAEPCGEGKARTDGGDCVVVDPEDTGKQGTDSGTQDTNPSTDSGEPAPEPVLDVYLLAGQSNMDGGGLNTALSPGLQIAQEDVWLFWSGWWQWQGLAPASYWGSSYFGPEVTFGRTLADSDPKQPVALIKYAISGTDLAQCWYPGASKNDGTAGDCYAGFRSTVDAALEILEENDLAWRVAGMAWMQGESDATYQPWAEAYEENLTAFVRRVREDMSLPKMPFAMGRIDCRAHCAYRDTVRAAQDAVAEALDRVSVVETEDLPQIMDSLHYDGSGMRTLGERLAASLQGVEEEAETSQPATELTGSFNSFYTGDYVVGYVFETDREISITDLGTLDYGWDGLSDGAEVAIWDATTSNLLAKATVPAAKSAQSSLWDRWRFVGIDPVELSPGRYVIGSQVYNGSEDRYVHSADVAFKEGITWIEGRHAVGTTVQLPTTVVQEEASWFGPNFLFQSAGKESSLP